MNFKDVCPRVAHQTKSFVPRGATGQLSYNGTNSRTAAFTNCCRGLRPVLVLVIKLNTTSFVAVCLSDG
eukprot:m.54504 g.54504  ORF g.54504 m.54504 type:complete len:69 (-) comp15511_c0_seq1:98-304(-)